jgi:hypothetical protein
VRPAYEVAAAVAPVPARTLVLALTADFLPLKTSHVEECPDIGPACASPTPPKPYNHVVKNYAYGLTLDAQYGIARWAALSLSAPYRFTTTRVRYTDLAGNAFDPVPPDTHHRNETLMGFGDPTLALVIGRGFDRLGFAVRLGAMLPFGRTLDENPFIAGREGRVHEHIQYGTGTVRPIVGSVLGYDFGAVGLDGYFQGTLSVATNSIGYRTGQRIVGGLRVSSALGLTAARLGLGLEASHETSETWDGTVQEEGNLGRTDVLAVLTARWSPFRRWGFFGAFKAPLHVNAVGSQLSYPFVVQIGGATGFSL